MTMWSKCINFSPILMTNFSPTLVGRVIKVNSCVCVDSAVSLHSVGVECYPSCGHTLRLKFTDQMWFNRPSSGFACNTVKYPCLISINRPGNQIINVLVLLSLF